MNTTAMRLISAFAKRLLPLLLVLTLPVAVQGQHHYLIGNGTITITQGNCFDGAVAIPDTIDGLPVTTIGNYAFARIGDWALGQAMAMPALPHIASKLADRQSCHRWNCVE